MEVCLSFFLECQGYVYIVCSTITALFFLCEYYPGAESLLARYIEDSGPTEPQSIVSEKILWSYAAQLTCALRAIHKMGIACQVLTPRRILVASQSRLRISGTGVLDVLEYDSNKSKRVDDLQVYYICAIFIIYTNMQWVSIIKNV